MMKPDFTAKETLIKSLGKTTIKSPLSGLTDFDDKRRILYHPYTTNGKSKTDISFEVSSHEKRTYFDPKKVTAAVVTCGGLCPGLNNVIRAIVLSLWHSYGVRKIVGIKYGFQGFIAEYEHPFIALTPEKVADIHEMGGSILGSSRGDQDISAIVDSLERQSINMLFTIGGDGTLNAASKIGKEITKRGLKISVIGVPKTIDNDISNVSHSFGFDTAVEIATQSIQSAHAEAESYPNGIGLVKLMGRNSGFIAATAAQSQRVVNFVFIPEVDFDLEGPDGFFAELEKRLERRFHAVIVVAEGAGQRYFEESNETDASGNTKLKDIGVFLKSRIIEHFEQKGISVNLKYIDPSYLIRSVPANTADGLFCATLGQNAVHAAMAGKTAMVVSVWHGVYCNLPIELAIRKRKVINPKGSDWINVLESTGQPSFKNKV